MMMHFKYMALRHARVYARRMNEAPSQQRDWDVFQGGCPSLQHKMMISLSLTQIKDHWQSFRWGLRLLMTAQKLNPPGALSPAKQREAVTINFF